MKLATGLTTMTQLVALTIGIPVTGALAGSTSLAGLHRGIGADVAVNAVFAAAIWVGLRPRVQTETISDALSGATPSRRPVPGAGRA